MNNLAILLIAIVVVATLVFSLSKFKKPVTPKPEEQWEDQVNQLIESEIESSLANMTEEEVENAILSQLA